MPKRSRITFDEGQKRLLWKTAHDVYEQQFKDKESPQKKMGLALGITQTTISALLRRKYTPSVHVAEQLSMLAGHEELEDLIGPYFLPNADDGVPPSRKGVYPKLRTCLDFHGRERWKPWTMLIRLAPTNQPLRGARDRRSKIRRMSATHFASRGRAKNGSR